MVEKILAKNSEDDKLVEECEENTNCSDCDPKIEWTTPAHTKTTPPENTVAVIVDVRTKRGAIRIFDKSGDYLGGIGVELAGKLVIVPWESTWYMTAAGSLRVGYITRKVV